MSRLAVLIATLVLIATPACTRTPDGARIRMGLAEERVVGKLGTPDAIKDVTGGKTTWYTRNDPLVPSATATVRYYYYLARGTRAYQVIVENGKLKEVAFIPEGDLETIVDTKQGLGTDGSSR